LLGAIQGEEIDKNDCLKGDVPMYQRPKYINPQCYEDEQEIAGCLPDEPGFYTFKTQGSMKTADEVFQSFLREAYDTREGFQLLSTNVVPQFNGVILYATYTFSRALTVAEVEAKRKNRNANQTRSYQNCY